MTSTNYENYLKKINRTVRNLLPSKNTYLHLRLKTAHPGDQFPNVKWLSHHIPKTAGQSLKHSLTQAFGENQIQEAYSDSNLPKVLSQGDPIWVPESTQIIHGHFRPHINHTLQFPNAHRIIWIRDPVERNISLLNHVLNHTLIQNRFTDFQSKVTQNKYSPEESFSKMIADEAMYSATRIYESYLTGFRKSDFAFVGLVSKYKEELMRLEDIMGIKLTENFKNIASKNTNLTIDIQFYKRQLQSEYELLENWV